MFHPLTNYRFRTMLFSLVFLGFLLATLALSQACDIEPGTGTGSGSVYAAPVQRGTLDFDVTLTAKGDIAFRFKDSERARILLAYAKSKGYAEQIWVSIDGVSTINTFAPNPQTPGEYLTDFFERELSELLLGADVETAKRNAEKAIRDGAVDKLPKPIPKLLDSPTRNPNPTIK